ncbi:ATP-binding protein [Streptomyces sp. NBC_00289]|uniref:ATP-binding protein n=1 Tax=Streptomyces sp. NBC_00289 TaxID=2975703 RepID=UPI00352D2D21
MTPPTTTPPRQSQRAASDQPRLFDLPLEHGPTAPAAARHQARPVLASWGLTQTQVYDTLLVISELVTNAITHAAPPSPCTCRPPQHAASYTSASATAAPSPPPPPGQPPGPETNTAAAPPSSTPSPTRPAPTQTPTPAGLINHWANLTAA